MPQRFILVCLLAVAALLCLRASRCVAGDEPPAEWLTTAEASDYRATAKSAVVVRLVDKMVAASPLISKLTFGKTIEGRPLVAAVAADPPIQEPETWKTDDRLVVVVLANIHSGECAGKEALLALLRDVATGSRPGWLDHVVLLAIPNFNADGNDRMSPDHRPRQKGPVDGMGIRENAQHLDLNRDFVKLETSEGQALVGLANRWNPHALIDLHTTNGSWHQYALTYDFPHNPAAPARVRAFLRDTLLPEVSRRLQTKGVDSFFYGNFNKEHSEWRTYGHQPRYSTEYFGLRGTLGILAEAHAHISFRDRVHASKLFVAECLDYLNENARRVRRIVARSRQYPSSAGNEQLRPRKLAVRAEMANQGKTVTIKGYDPTTLPSSNPDESGAAQQEPVPADHQVKLLHRFRATDRVVLPCAYLLPRTEGRVADRLKKHGVAIHKLAGDTEVDATVYVVDRRERAERDYQGHRFEKLSVSENKERRVVPAGTYVIWVEQRLGRLAAYMLEPTSDDGLAAWGFFAKRIADEGSEFPVSRIDEPCELDASPVKRIEAVEQLTLEEIYGSRRVPFHGTTAKIRWLSSAEVQPDDSKSDAASEQPESSVGSGENEKRAGKSYYMRTVGDRQVRVDATTGAEKRIDNRARQEPVASALAALPGIGAEVSMSLASRHQQVSSDREGRLFAHGDDLYYYSARSESAKRLTNTLETERFAQFSPDGRFVAFVRTHDLYVVDVETARERALTTDGTADIMFGELDWAYQEEVYGRGNYRAFWWSPDSRRLAFLRIDQSHVKSYTVADNIPYRQSLEVTRYPKAGDPIARARLGMIAAIGGLVTWADDYEHSDRETLIVRVDWSASSKHVYYQLQNREQTWLELRTTDPSSGTSKLILRETSKAWVEPQGAPRELKDGIFLWLSQRTGQRHIYHCSADGNEVRAVTAGDWDVKQLLGVDAAENWVYFTATKDSPTRLQCYRVHPSGEQLQRLTDPRSSHRVVFDDRFEFFLDYSSQVHSPQQVWVHRADGRRLFCEAPNQVDILDYYQLERPEFYQVPNREGSVMEAMLIKPPDFDPDEKYPVICHVYGGPAAPQVWDRWRGSSYLWHQMMAQRGYCIWMCDNTSASTGGVKRTWPIYRDLGRRELADVEDGLGWLKSKRWVDPERIGIWGWSYGGYLASYALTHSQSFRAGIAGAPVTDWRNYDAIYTERYMDLPQRNPDGYRDSSVVSAAANLHGHLLLIHGSKDDNVHLANTLQLAYSLQKAGKQFDMMVYPKNRHGIGNQRQSLHLRHLITQFFLERL